MKKTGLLIFALSLIFILAVQFIGAEGSTEENLTLQQQAQLCLTNSESILNELIENNFSYQRVNDSLTKAQSLYDAQKLLEQKGKKVDFSLVLPYCDDIKNIKALAFDAIDEYSSLKKFYNVSITQEMNSSEVDALLIEIENEIISERYENVPSLVDNAYKKISEIRASYSALNLFYAATARGIKNFFQKNWLPISITLGMLLILYLIFYKKIRKRIIESKLQNLELRRKTLQELIKKTQKDYFQYGKMSQGNYNLRTKKFAEFIRDIDRQIPLLKEQLMKIAKKKAEKVKIREKNIRKPKRKRFKPKQNKIPKYRKIKLRKVKIKKTKIRRRK